MELFMKGLNNPFPPRFAQGYWPITISNSALFFPWLAAVIPPGYASASCPIVSVRSVKKNDD